MVTIQISDAGAAKWRELLQTYDVSASIRLSSNSNAPVVVFALRYVASGELAAQQYAPIVFDESGAAFLSLDVAIWSALEKGHDIGRLADDDVPFNVMDLQQAYREVTGRG